MRNTRKTTNPEYPMITHKDAKSVLINKMAERVGFEPTVAVTLRLISNQVP